MKDHCTCCPESFFGIYIGDICKLHDRAYAAYHNCFWHRMLADCQLGYRVASRDFKLIPIGIGMSLVLFFLGGYAWRKAHK